MLYDSIIPIIISFAVSVILGPLVIPFLRRLKVGQTVRDDGPKSHLSKSGTPTMGGILILVGIVVASVFYIKDYPKIIPILFLTLGFGLVGFLDDYIKVVLKRSMGLRAWQKMGLQIIITGIFIFYIYQYTDISLAMKVPFMPDTYIDMGWFNILFMFIVILGTDTGANFTDGLDGLASSVTLMIAMFFTVVAMGTQSGIEPITCAVVGALLGFLLFNVHPASVFMGDTGSLALGGFVAATAYVLQMPLFLVIVACIYVAEVLSVILQVGYFKITKGKRLFKMAPIHHHFELCGWKETKIVAVFTIITAIACLIALMGV
ncbi:MAG: phospho-N-acetylmuramoyl-pentapeptide-transferase [Lachnospiraceae bacterium]|nr:phospho-N-acetylmuramoyl-pentapeptide-transferase [Lachnospiraceae bacterium]MBQ3037108.1 phospho-N-acetylmuramoyl-pentapeptide-transferase [Lachnospiraceae bacterium]